MRFCCSFRFLSDESCGIITYFDFEGLNELVFEFIINLCLLDKDFVNNCAVLK